METQETNNSTNSGIKLSPLMAAFFANVGRLEAVPAKVAHYGVKIERAIQTALATAKRIEPLIPDMRTLPKIDMDAIVGLSTTAMACQYANAMWLRPAAPPNTIADAIQLRTRMLAGAELLVTFGLAEEDRVAAIRGGGVRHVEIANGLGELAAFYIESWERVKGKTPVDERMIEQAGELGMELTRLLAGAESKDPAIGNLTRKVARDRAWTLLVSDYSQVQRAVGFLRWDEGDADEFAPSLYLKERRSGEDGEDDEDEEVGETKTVGDVNPGDANA